MDFERENITLTEIMEHSKKHGRKATAMLLHILGKKRPHYDAIRSEVGQLLLKPIIDRMDELLEKISIRKNTEEEGIEYDILCRLVNEWAIIIHNYQKDKQKLKGA